MLQQWIFKGELSTHFWHCCQAASKKTDQQAAIKELKVAIAILNALCTITIIIAINVHHTDKNITILYATITLDARNGSSVVFGHI